mmetsp:Transcript_89387/g.204366  ORF Transcript_89387/g.204366 Transcript_89387/m.204366 type:complete len:226 (+) Transcript_89387:69-746(+)
MQTYKLPPRPSTEQTRRMLLGDRERKTMATPNWDRPATATATSGAVLREGDLLSEDELERIIAEADDDERAREMNEMRMQRMDEHVEAEIQAARRKRAEQRQAATAVPPGTPGRYAYRKRWMDKGPPFEDEIEQLEYRLLVQDNVPWQLQGAFGISPIEARPGGFHVLADHDTTEVQVLYDASVDRVRRRPQQQAELPALPATPAQERGRPSSRARANGRRIAAS